MNTQLSKSSFHAILTLPVIASLLFSCGRKSNLEDVSGDVVVQIPVSESKDHQVQYKLKEVTLKSVSNLKIMDGEYARFYYSPGQSQNNLIGDAPQARFIKNRSQVYIPADTLSQQMATIYYHLQNLIQLSRSLGLSPEIASKMNVGIHVQVGQSALSKNNAFYDGVSDAFLFVPFTSQEVPIAVNSGIIAHEYFHSLFYKKVLRGFQSVKTNKSDVNLYNETYLRGLNEGLADYWGWLYSQDENFMQWSLSQFSKNRKLVLANEMQGVFESTEKIFTNTSRVSGNPIRQNEYLSDYIYKIGTPVARFLKTLTLIRVSENLSLSDSQNQTTHLVLNFMDQLKSKMNDLTADEVLEAEQIFKFVGENSANMKMEECDFIAKYVQKAPGHEDDICVQKDNGHYKIEKVVINE